MIWQVFRYELTRNIRRRGFLFATFGIPLLAFLLPLGYQALESMNVDIGSQLALLTQGSDAPERAGYVDETGMFTESGQLTPYADESAANDGLEAGDITTYYIIPADYLETGEVIQVMPSLSLTAINQDAIREVLLNSLARDVEPEIARRLEHPATFNEVNLEQRAQTNSFDSSFLLVYVFTLALMLGIFMTNGYLLQGVIEEKESRVIEILMSSLRPTQLLVGKILAFGTLGLLQMLTWVIGVLVLLRLANVLDLISGLAGVTIPPDVLPLTVVYFVLAYLFFACAYGILGAVSVSMREGPQYAAVFTLPAAIPLWFMTVFIENPNAPLPVALSLIPITAPLSMIQRMLMTTVPAWQIAASLLLLVVTIVAMLWLAGRLFRVHTLLAGQAPKLRDLPRLVRG